ncbi:5-formyltetrahydrofolate cyclo-ligase [Aestuariivirga sp.]|uniref:5-formyltetrahydrofolate cyclo-ligase n=1 Tax=Aestuariivirga sp. TaxID=2650926 RepID=UPI0039E44DFD
MPESVAQWRQLHRKRLLEERLQLGLEARQEIAQSIAQALDIVLAQRFSSVRGRTISAYWPIKSELDLRFWMTDLHRRGARVALPVVEEPGAPLVFRAWSPQAQMERGHWNILVPCADAPKLHPDVALAPLVGWDNKCYRLGYGGGYFDRTLAVLSPRPWTIGVGLHSARIDSIQPQPHDVRLDAIVTEMGLKKE